MEKIKTLSLDLETYSSVSLKKAGVYPYAESPDFEILLFGYSVNGGPVQVVDIACGEQFRSLYCQHSPMMPSLNGPLMRPLNASVCPTGCSAIIRSISKATASRRIPSVTI